jgi:hypothetical protein
MTGSGSGKAVRSRAEWAAVVEAQERSGESAARFCPEQSLCYSQFLYRRKALKKRSQSLAMSGSLRGVSVSGFIPVKVEEGGGVRLRFPQGPVLESDRLPSAAWLVEVARRWADGEDSPC